MDQTGLGDLIDIALKSECHDIGLKTVDHGASLLARSAVRLFYSHIVSALRLPILGKGRVNLFVQLAGGMLVPKDGPFKKAHVSIPPSRGEADIADPRSNVR